MNKDTGLAARIRKINPSSTLAITSKAKKLKSEGIDVISLAAGEPDFDTPDFIKDAAIAAIKSGFTKYTPTSGIPELKKLICEKFKRDNGLDYRPEQIVVSCGAKHSIFNTLFVLVDKDEEVIIPSPYWVSYPEMVKLCEAKACFIETSAENGFKISPEALTKSITPGTKLLILNSPANPTGCVYSAEELKAIAGICVEHNIYVLSDEIYEKLIYGGLKHCSIAGFNNKIKDLTISVNGLSKSFSMTGWRIGYLAARQDIAEAVAKFQDHSTSNPASISQKAAVAALSAGNEFSRKINSEFQKRRDFMLSRLQKMQKISCFPPQGAFYIFCGIKNTGLNSTTFAQRALDEISLAIIPGAPFGRDDYVRLSFASGIEELGGAMDRLGAWLNKL